MKKHPLSEEQINEVLEKTPVGNLATINENGYPYVLPVHFVHHENQIFIHGLPRGQKISNILANEKVCFETFIMKGLILDDAPCDVNTEYESVLIMGKASIIRDDIDLKIDVLNRIVAKYTPHLEGINFPEKALRGTSIIEIEIEECTGKYYK